MSLAKCPNCNKNCSTLAATCPWCDQPLGFNNSETRNLETGANSSSTNISTNKGKLLGKIGLVLICLAIPACLVIGETSASSYKFDGTYNDAGAKCGYHKITGEAKCGYDSDGLIFGGLFFGAGVLCIAAGSTIHQNQYNSTSKQQSDCLKQSLYQSRTSNADIDIAYKGKPKFPFKFKKHRSPSLVKRWKREIKKYGD